MLDAYFHRCWIRVHYVAVAMLGATATGKGYNEVLALLDLMVS